MHKRLVGILASVAVIVTACGGATTSTAPSAPAASTAPAGSTAPAASGASTAPASTAPSGGDLAPNQVYKIYLAATDPRSLNPQGASGSDEIAVLGATNRGLLYYDKDLNLVPGLATALPTVSADHLTYTFTLKDAKYSNNDPIVAADIVRSFRKLADPRNAFDYGYEACLVDGAAAVLGEDFGCAGTPTPYLDPAKGTFDDAKVDGLLDKLGVSAPDPKTFVVKLAKPVNYFSNIMAMWLTTPTNEKSTKYAEAADLISSGPFMVDTWTHNSEFVLKQNPNWYGDKPTLTEIHMAIGGAPEAAVAAYERGDLDTVLVPGSEARRVKDDATLGPQVQDLPQLSIAYYDFATCQNGPAKCPKNATTKDGMSPMANKNFRIAMTEAINKQELIDVTYAGLLKPADGSVMPGIPGWPDDYHPYAFDVAKAQASMKTALTELGVTDTNKDGKVDVLDVGKLKFGYNCDAGHTPRVVYLAGAWRTNLGFSETQFDISCTDFGVFRTERRAGNKYDISRNAWGADFPHPSNQLLDLFACGAGNNNSQYCNKAFDDLLSQASAEIDPTKAHDLYVKAQRLLVDDAPVIWLGYGQNRYMVKPYVQGLQATASDHQNIGDVFYETIKIGAH
jgi:oligopeptide transport system substrate-binding protein